MSTECIFCKLNQDHSLTNVLLENESFFVIPDINPQRKTHLLIISKDHAETIHDLKSNTGSDFLSIINELKQTLDTPTYNILVNTGAESGQEVFHFHAHFLSKYDYSI